MAKCRCSECGNNSGNWIVYRTTREYKGNGYDFELEVDIPYCEKCGSPINDKEVEEKIRERANKIIREKTNIISQKEIIELVETYNASQKFLSRVLGWGEVTLPRYIKGSYSPSVENSNKLKSIRNPYILMDLVEKNIDDDDSAKEKLINNINQQLEVREMKNGKIYQVVDWFLTNANEEEGITHLALQKVLYFVQAWSYIFNKEWIFPEECEAWVHGAVYRKIYDEFKSFKYLQLPKLNMESKLSEEEIRVLQFVKENYLDVYSAKSLEKICHLEDPFKITRGKLEEKSKSEFIISKEKISEYYSKIAKKYNIDVNNRRNINDYLHDLLFE